MKTDPRELASSAGEQLHRFHGGLRLRHNKKISCQQPVERPPLPERLYVPLLQHRGTPATPLIKAGDRVLKGQCIGASGPRGAPIHAPSSGLVLGLEEGPIGHLTGQTGTRVVIELDGEDRWGALEPLSDWLEQSPDVLRRHIQAAGIVGLGGAVFPTEEKLTSGQAARIETLILNGAECEPYISCDEMLMREHPRYIVEGARMLRRAAEAERVVIAIEDQMGAVHKALDRAARQLGAGSVRVVRIPKIYPEGGERQLVQTLTGMEVPAGSHPHELGLLVMNVATAAATRTALKEGKPLLERNVTVTGNGVQTPRNLLTLLGTPVSHLIACCGGYSDDVARLVVGGPMMGVPLPSDAAPVVKGTNCLLALSQDDIRAPQTEMPCIRCGDCTRSCPAQLMPQDLHFHIRNQQWDALAALGVESCIECGCCDFVCPSHIPLTNWFRYGKGELRELQRERHAAEHARERHEARTARLATAKAEKAARLARRKARLADQDGRKQQIAAALARAKGGRRNRPEDADS